MLLKIISDVLKEDKNFLVQIKNLISLTKYYIKLQKGIKSKKIYHLISKQDPSLVKLLENINDENLKLIDELFHKDVKNFLKDKELKKHLDFDNKNCALQLGQNTLYTEKPITGVWTTGKAIFYIPTSKKEDNRISLELRSIAPLKVTLGFENKEVTTYEMPQLTTRKFTFEVKSNEVSDPVSEIFVKTDKLWYPSLILKSDSKLIIGVGVKSIDVSYF